MSEALCKGPTCGRCLKTCPGDAVERMGPRLGRLRHAPLAARLRAAHGSSRPHHPGRRCEEAERPASLRGQLQPLAEHPARRGRGHRLPALRRRLPGRRRLRAMLADALEEIPENTPDEGARASTAMNGRGSARPEALHRFPQSPLKLPKSRKRLPSCKARASAPRWSARCARRSGRSEFPKYRS